MCKSQTFWIYNDDYCSDFVYAHNRDAQTLINFSNSFLKCQKFVFGFCQFYKKAENLGQGTLGNNPLMTKGIWVCSLPLFYGELLGRFLLMLPLASSWLKPEQKKREKWQGKRQISVQWTTGCGGLQPGAGAEEVQQIPESLRNVPGWLQEANATFRLPLGSKLYIEVIRNLVWLIFSNQELSGAVFTVEITGASWLRNHGQIASLVLKARSHWLQNRQNITQNTFTEELRLGNA